MAHAVHGAFSARRHLFVQAGTGTGKSMAYLVPAVLAGETVVVVTATRALQEQLYRKDLPFLASTLRELGHDCSFAQLKGRSNYLCRAKLAEHALAGTAVLEGTRAAVDVADALAEWAGETDTGDRADFADPIPDATWAMFSTDSRECPGRAKCAYGEECFAERARDTAARVGIVVVNTALYAQHLAAERTVLAEHSLVVVDEAHMIEDVCTTAFGVELGARRLERLAAEVRTFLAGERGGDADAVLALNERGRRWDALLRECPNEQPVDLDAAGLRGALAALAEQLGSLAATVAALDAADSGASQKQLRVRRLVDALREDVQLVLGASPARDAIWVERRDPPVLRVAPIDIGPRLAGSLFASCTAVLTSATLALGDDFGPLAWRLGLRREGPPEPTPDVVDGDDRPSDPHAFDTLDVGSPFDYRTQAILYCAAHLPDPRTDEFATAWLAEAVELVRAAGGRTLGLCTSLRAADALRDTLRAEFAGVRVLAPDDLPRSRLMQEFAADETSCLVGSMGLWQGLDVPGPSVSLVLVDKIPFARPNDPLAVARRDQAAAGGRDPFRTFDLPRAALLLAQGAGRLIRSAADRGVVAVLDRRLVTSGYGRTLIDSLPPMYRMTDPARVRSALQRLAVENGRP
jgi:ATP-dependent DNA helicase DinG